MLIYLAGKYSGDVVENIEKARAVAVECWEKGYAVICPHLNTAHMELDCKCTWEDYLSGDFEMIRKCDAIVMLEGWTGSKGAVAEHKLAKEINLPTYYYPELPPLVSGGVKYDDGKLRYDLISSIGLERLASVYTMGAKKYGDHNYRSGLKWSRVFGAVMRHLWAFWRNEDLDKESGLPHLAHAAWGCFALLEYAQTHKELDDRWKSE